MRTLEPYHLAWLEAHPHRSVEWLRERLADGFDVHHVDGDHGNDTPGNLVLIEQSDHLALHGVEIGKMLRTRRAVDLALAQEVYEEYAATDVAWSELSRARGHSHSWAYHMARKYAQESGVAWPIKTPGVKRGLLGKPRETKNAYFKMIGAQFL